MTSIESTYVSHPRPGVEAITTETTQIYEQPERWTPLQQSGISPGTTTGGTIAGGAMPSGETYPATAETHKPGLITTAKDTVAGTVTGAKEAVLGTREAVKERLAPGMERGASTTYNTLGAMAGVAFAGVAIYLALLGTALETTANMASGIWDRLPLVGNRSRGTTTGYRPSLLERLTNTVNGLIGTATGTAAGAAGAGLSAGGGIMNTLSNLFNMSLRLLYAAIGAYLTFLVNTLNWLQRTLANATGWLLARRQSYTAGTGFTGMGAPSQPYRTAYGTQQPGYVQPGITTTTTGPTLTEKVTGAVSGAASTLTGAATGTDAAAAGAGSTLTSGARTLMDYGFAGAEAYLNTISRLLGGGQSFLGRAVDWVASKRTTGPYAGRAAGYPGQQPSAAAYGQRPSGVAMAPQGVSGPTTAGAPTQVTYTVPAGAKIEPKEHIKGPMYTETAEMPSKPETAGVYPGGHYPGVGTPQTSEALRPGAQTGAYQRPAAHAGTTGRAF